MSAKDMETIAGVDVYLPAGAIDTAPQPLAPRLDTLRGARIGILDNGKEFADVVLDGVVEVLKREYQIKDIVFWRKGFPAKGAPFLAEMAASCDAVIGGVGH